MAAAARREEGDTISLISRKTIDFEQNTAYSKQQAHSASTHHQWRENLKFHQTFSRLLLPGLARSFVTWLLVAAFYITTWTYKDRVLSPHKKSEFDAITIALSLALGLNVASALKANALDLRWWVLSMEKRPAREVELILHADSMTELVKLAFIAPRPRTLTTTFFWLALNILAQAGIAVLGLTYSATPGMGDIFREPKTGNVAVPNMTFFAPESGRFGNSLTELESFAAHVLGDVGSSYNFSTLPEKPLKGTSLASNPAGFWNATDHWEYYFLDSAPLTATSGYNTLAIYTDRVVKSTATCTTPPYKLVHNGQLIDVQLTEENRSFAYPAVAFGQESIFYLTKPLPSSGKSDGQCGPGCTNVKALEPAAGPPDENSTFKGVNGTFFYDCNITVTANTSDVEPVKAAQAAQAIALSGQIHPEFQALDEYLNQFVGYNFGLPFGEPQNNSATGMASLVSRFAIGVISAAAQTNPTRDVRGHTPAQGVRMEFDSMLAFNVILLLTGLGQLALVLVTAVIVRRIKVPHETLMSRQESIQSQYVLIEGQGHTPAPPGAPSVKSGGPLPPRIGT